MSNSIYVEMGHHPQVILDTLDQVKQAIPRIEFGHKMRRIGGWMLILLPILVFILAIILIESACVPFVAMALFMGGIIAGGWLIRSAKVQFLQQNLEAAYQILYTLRDDTGSKGRVVGWLDLSNPTQKEKIERTGSSGGGKSKVYYRNPWFQVKINLVDGNLLRLALVDKIKTKAGNVVNRRTQFTAKLVVNPNLYHVSAIPHSGLPLSNVSLVNDSNDLITLTANVDPKNTPTSQILETLKVLYSHLEPISQDLPVAGQDPS